MRKTKNAMTLMEIIIVIVIIGILSMAGMVGYRQTVLRARDREAQAMLRLVKHAEEVLRLEAGAYAGCANTAACNVTLRLNLPDPGAANATWLYSVPVATATNVCAQALAGPAGQGAGFSIRRNNAPGGIDQQDPVAGGCP
jgi:prepilin-type N-terminal cleavage/methylation domain-containing protein